MRDAGLTGSVGAFALDDLGDLRRAEEFLRYVDIRTAVGIELAEADSVCHDLLEANRPALIAVARLLFERSSVVGAEIAALLEDARSKEAPKPATSERGVVLRLVDDPGRQEGPWRLRRIAWRMVVARA